MREDTFMIQQGGGPIRVMRIIARMNVGGPAVQVSGLMRSFNQKDFNQTLYTGFCSADEADYLEVVARDITSVRIEGLGRRIHLKDDLNALIFLTREIRRIKPDIVHTHTAKAGFLGRIASILSLHPSIRIHTFHGHLLNGYFGPFKRLMVICIEVILASFTHQLLAVGDKVRQDLLKVRIGSPGKFGLMPPGLEITRLPRKSESQLSFHLLPEQLQCALIGRVTQIKRPDRFLDVVAECKNRGYNINFFVAGDGELFEYCRERILKEDLPVALLGWQTNIEKVLSAADIVLLTSDNEGTPLSLIQAGMAGLPVVSTRVGSVSEVVLDRVTGIIVDLDVQLIADAIGELATDKKLRLKLGNSAHEFTLANFGVARLVQDHEILYKELVANRAKS